MRQFNLLMELAAFFSAIVIVLLLKDRLLRAGMPAVYNDVILGATFVIAINYAALRFAGRKNNSASN